MKKEFTPNTRHAHHLLVRQHHRDRSTRGDFASISVRLHPFFTGKQKLIDAEGRVDRFNKNTAARLRLLP